MHPLFYHQGKLKYSKMKRGSVSCRQSIRQTYYYLYSILSNLTRTKSPRRHFDAELTLAPCVSGRAGARQRLVPPQSICSLLCSAHDPGIELIDIVRE